VSQIGHIVTGMVDNIFLGAIGKTEQAAGILATNLFVLILVFGIGISYAATPLTSAASIDKNNTEKGFLLKNSVYMNLGISVILFLVLFFMSPLLGKMGQPQDVVEMAIPFFNVLIFSIIPVSFYFSAKQYAEGLSNTKMAMYISIVGNLLNIVLNYLLINGYCGLPEMGYMGAAWATFTSRVFMGAAAMYIIMNNKKFSYVRPFYKAASVSKKHLSRLFKIGIGSALQFTFEVAAFILCGLMTGWYGKEQIDAHGIAMSMAAFTYMFGSGIGGAVSIRVAGFRAQGDTLNMKMAGKSSFIMVVCLMSCIALLFFLFHTFLPMAFTRDKEILELASGLLLIAAFFQLFDGTQVVALGVLRGMEDVKFPTIVTLIAYWGIALPLAYFLAEKMQLRAYGVWYALSLSLILVAVALYWRFRFLTRNH
jgi:MATE family multidrug resistance protein